MNKFLTPWCTWHQVGIDDIDNTGEQLLCCAHLVEARCFVCRYTPDDIINGMIHSKDGFKDQDFEPIPQGIAVWQELKQKEKE